VERNGQVVYRQREIRGGRQQCRACREGAGHGPCWYARDQHEATTPNACGRLVAAETFATDQARQVPARTECSTTAVAPSSRGSLRIYLLGRFAVERIFPSTAPLRVTWRRSTAAGLLQVLLLHTRVDREQAASLLFPNDGEQAAQGKLSTALHALRRALEPGLRAGEQGVYIVQHRTLLSLELDVASWVDARAFQSLVKEAHQATRPVAVLERALMLYLGDLLPDEPHAWSVPHREQFHRYWQEAVLQLAHCLRDAGLYERCLAALGWLEADDRLFEPAARLQMRVHAELGRPADAVGAYRRLVRALHEDLAVAPCFETRQLAEAIRRGAVHDVR
jgi:DNA-binding SARP family transcriptional activator